MTRQVILLGHGKGCIGMKQSVEMIIGRQENLVAFPLKDNCSVTDYAQEIKDFLLSKKGDNFVLLADIKGGTPGNVSTMMKSLYPDVQVATGFHLAMIIEACLNETASIEEIVANTLSSVQVVSLEK